MTWIPLSCMLPTEQQPLRVAEFDTLFADSLRGVEPLSPTKTRLTLDAASEPAARELTARETRCCSFFVFSFARDQTGLLLMDVAVPDRHVRVLDALTSLAVRSLPTGAAQESG